MRDLQKRLPDQIIPPHEFLAFHDALEEVSGGVVVHDEVDDVELFDDGVDLYDVGVGSDADMEVLFAQDERVCGGVWLSAQEAFDCELTARGDAAIVLVGEQDDTERADADEGAEVQRVRVDGEFLADEFLREGVIVPFRTRAGLRCARRDANGGGGHGRWRRQRKGWEMVTDYAES